MELDAVLKLISGFGAIFGIPLTITHLLTYKNSGKLKRYEIFKEIKGYLADYNSKSYPVICAAINCISKRELTLDEVKWFIDTPHAFEYIKAYSDQERYIEISEKMDSFRYSDKYSSKAVRNLEHLKLATAYVILSGIGVFILLLTQSQAEMFLIAISGYISGVICIFFGVMMLIQKGHLTSSKLTVERKFDVVKKQKKS
ncbi:hypothetical protein ABIS04_13200 [Shewanella sp. H8]|uniref:hypothetical protein n=1 Tax=Shewanella sp. H8 TaxID=3342676 RepID=UPI003314E4A5